MAKIRRLTISSEDLEELELANTTDGSIKCYSPIQKQFDSFM